MTSWNELCNHANLHKPLAVTLAQLMAQLKLMAWAKYTTGDISQKLFHNYCNALDKKISPLLYRSLLLKVASVTSAYEQAGEHGGAVYSRPKLALLQLCARASLRDGAGSRPCSMYSVPPYTFTMDN